MNTQPQMKLLQVVLLTMMQGVGVIAIARLASAEIPERSQLVDSSSHSPWTMPPVQLADNSEKVDAEALVRAAGDSVPKLIKLLKHTDIQVRRSAAAAIPNSKFLEAETLDLSFKSSLFEES